MTKAVRIHSNGGPEVMRWEDVALPPPGAGEARIRHTAIGVNYSDVNVRRGGFYLARPLRFPVILGNEAAGVVESVGPSMTFAPAIASPMRGCAGSSSRTRAPMRRRATFRWSV
jgi:NADPH2:quinone reductase